MLPVHIVAKYAAMATGGKARMWLKGSSLDAALLTVAAYVVIRDAGAAAKFDVHFEGMWDAAQPMDEFGPAINALEPR